MNFSVCVFAYIVVKNDNVWYSIKLLMEAGAEVKALHGRVCCAATLSTGIILQQQCDVVDTAII